MTKPLILKTICFTFIALTFSVLSSCATNKDTDFLDINSGAIENDLKLSKSKFKKFSIKKVSPDKKNKPRPSTTLEKDKKDSQTKGGGTGSQKSKQEKLDLGAKDKVVAGSLFYPYPSNYPEALKKYDKISLKTWSLSRPKIFLGEKFTFRVAYLGITAGHIQMETLPIVEIGDREAYHFKAHMRSARYYSYIYKLDDSLESFASVGDFIPMKYVLLQRESGQKVDDVQLFDREELKTYHFYKRLKKGKTKELEIEKPIPRFFQDSFSALHFVRGFPMNKGDLYEFPIVTRGKIWILKIKVEGKETIDVNGTDVLAFRLNAETRFPGVLEKKGDILFWYSADKDKKLLKFEAQVKIGAVRGELVDYTPGRSIETL